MSEFWAFIKPSSLLPILNDAARKNGLNVVLHRYTKDGGSALRRLVKPDEDLTSLYVDGGYSEVFLTTAAPKDSSDLRYLESDDDYAHTIMMGGGRVSATAIEEANVRLMFKKTKVRGVYNTIRRAIRKVSDQGVMMAGKWPYPKIYWERSLRNDSREWRRELGEEGVPCAPIVEGISE